MTAKHLAILGTCLVSIAALGSALPSWEAATSPAFVFGAIGCIGATLAAMYADAPGTRE